MTNVMLPINLWKIKIPSNKQMCRICGNHSLQQVAQVCNALVWAAGRTSVNTASNENIVTFQLYLDPDLFSEMSAGKLISVAPTSSRM